MKPIHVVLAVVGGAVCGATIGLLFAPGKGRDTREKLAKMLRKNGVCMKKNKMEKLVDDIENEIDGSLS